MRSEARATGWRERATLSLQETARLLGVAERGIEDRLEESGVRIVQHGRRRLVVTHSLREWLGEVGPEEPAEGRHPASGTVARKAATLARRLG